MMTSYPKTIERWGLQEIVLKGPSEGNPFTETEITGTFTGKNETRTAEGFYDGNGIYKVRFMPSFEGEYEFVIKTSFADKEIRGNFFVSPASKDNHGPVHVANTFHFAYEDGTPYYSIGTTCYVWDLQSDELIAQTLDALKKTAFNKIRFCIFPKHYDYNLNEPRSYPYEGTPMDSSVLTKENFDQYTDKTDGNHFDLTKFNPEHFRHIEYCITELMKLGIEADLIVMHPYDRWGFAQMTPEQDRLYWRYVIARFGAYRNVWWSLANEYDLLKYKTLADWESYGEIIMEKDPYHKLTSIHNCKGFYDYNRPWITHCSCQRQEVYLTAEKVNTWRETYRKPVVMDEMCYEGNLHRGWGNIPAEEMLRRFWETVCRGGYPGHGETYVSKASSSATESGDNHKPAEILWWSHGGQLHGESWKRFGFLLDVMKETPGLGLRYAPECGWESVTAVPEREFMQGPKSYYLFYFSFMQPISKKIFIDNTTSYHVYVLDTWNMTKTDCGIHSGSFEVDLPGKPYMAIQMFRVQNQEAGL